MKTFHALNERVLDGSVGLSEADMLQAMVLAYYARMHTYRAAVYATTPNLGRFVASEATIAADNYQMADRRSERSDASWVMLVNAAFHLRHEVAFGRFSRIPIVSRFAIKRIMNHP